MSESTKLPSKPAPPTGSDTVDAEHGVQLGLLDATITALSEEDAGAGELLDQLYTYSEAHFLSEQLLMRMAARANYEGHVEEHTRLLQDLDRVRAQLQKEQYSDARAALEAHRVRLLEHIRSWDRSVEDPPQPGAGATP
jgi:hemerythrin